MASAQAQVVDLRLREEMTGAPIVGALVRLLRDSTVAAQALTDAQGRAMLRPAGPGEYRIKVNRIGYRPMLGDAVVLAQGQTVRKELSMPSIRVALPAMTVLGKSQCGDQGSSGPLVAVLWEEIRTALAANVITQTNWALPLQVAVFRRDVTLDGATGSERVVASYVVRGPPFGATSPETLATRGFVRQSEGGSIFSAPDAALLLSDSFVNSHCFHAIEGTQAAGLQFEPLRGRRQSDVQGTIWVDRATSELKLLEYSYTGLAAELRDAGLGGRVEFRRLPTGAWIVNYWHIRMPRLDITPADYSRIRAVRPEQRRLIGYIDEGGRATVATTATVALAPATVSGRIFDSTTMDWLAGAVVRANGKPDSAVTDGEGQFALRIDGSGSGTIVVTHAKLGLLADRSSRAVQLVPDDTTRVDFTVPSPARFAREFCGQNNRAGLLGIASGVDGRPSENLDLRVSWKSSTGAPREERTVSGPNGIYVFCELPVGEALTLRVRASAAEQRATTVVVLEQPVRLDGEGFRWLDVRPPPKP